MTATNDEIITRRQLEALLKLTGGRINSQTNRIVSAIFVENQRAPEVASKFKVPYNTVKVAKYQFRKRMALARTACGLD